MLKRRKFLECCGLAGVTVLSPVLKQALWAESASRELGEELECDVAIIGGGLGGCAAALAACRLGAKVILTEPTDWIGGQVSQQAVPPDEHQWIEQFGRTESYARFREGIRNYYRKQRPLTEQARNHPLLNPGNGAVSRICHEPAVAVEVLQEMLAEEIRRGRLRLLLQMAPVSAQTTGDRVKRVVCRSQVTQREHALQADWFIDATEEGDLLPLTGTEYVLGAESQAETGEPHAPEKANPENIQSLTYCLAMDHLAGEDHTIERPRMYDFWKSHVPPLQPEWSGPLLALAYSHPRTLKPHPLNFVPSPASGQPPKTSPLNLWLYRRIIDRDNFAPGAYPSDITIMNWPQNDYMLGNITDVSPEERQKHLDQAAQLSLSLFYWLQTEAPRPDGGQGWKGLRLRKDIVGTDTGLAKYPYIRESRRIQAELTITEQDLSAEVRRKQAEPGTRPLLATPFADSVGIGYYHLDLHPSTGGDNYIDMASVPFQIPLGALIPQRMENLIPGCKNIGTTHISNGCYRLHPVEWSIGEAAGFLCAYAGQKQLTPRQIRNSPEKLADFQSLLTQNGFDLDWSKLKS